MRIVDVAAINEEEVRSVTVAVDGHETRLVFNEYSSFFSPYLAPVTTVTARRRIARTPCIDAGCRDRRPYVAWFGRSLCWTRLLSPAKTAEPTHRDAVHGAQLRGPKEPGVRQRYMHRSHLTNTIKQQSVLGGWRCGLSL